MCSHYQAVKNRERYRRHFGVEPPDDLGKEDVWPGYEASFIRRHPHVEVGDETVPTREALIGLYGLVPHWSPDTAIAKHTYNARSETVAHKPSFREAWGKARHCIIPADSFYEPDWRSGRATPTKIERADGLPMGMAGLWSSWRSPAGQIIHSFTLLTINADEHPLMKHLHKPSDEKRMVVILAEARYDDWLQAQARQSVDFLRQFPAELLTTSQPASQKRLF